MTSMFRYLAMACAAVLACNTARAQCVQTFADIPGGACDNYTISATNFTYEGCHIIVQDCVTLTIDGAHQFASLTVLDTATVTHTAASASGVSLTIFGDLFVAPSSRVSADFRGNISQIGPGAGPAGSHAGGGGHAGAGGDGWAGVGGGTYGSITEPTELGSGGGGGNGGTYGGSGGGVVRLTVGGTLTVEGTISANGERWRSGGYGGGGSGGSVRINCQALAGSGTISANGGAGVIEWSGGGGGGRVSVTTATSTFGVPGLQALGGAGRTYGGAGTIWYKVGNTATLLISNGGNAGEATEEAGDLLIDGDVLVQGAARFSPRHGIDGLHLLVNGDVDVEAGAAISADFRGNISQIGPGAGPAGSHAGGGGHAGAGGDGWAGVGGGTYGSITEPTELGSGGGGGNGGTYGGSGGGVVRLTVGGTLTVEGTISANGERWRSGGYGGGGSGGSVRINCQALAGSGTISANGGAGVIEWSGGGGGGRVSVTTATSTFGVPGLQALGGAGRTYGGAGTIWYKVGNAATLLISNGGPTGAVTEMTGETTVPGDVVVRGGARLGPKALDPTMHLVVTGNLAVEHGASVFADFRGFLSEGGPGAGESSTHAGGAGHGGRGGNGWFGLGGNYYDSISAPTGMGSGGGRDTDPGGWIGGKAAESYASPLVAPRRSTAPSRPTGRHVRATTLAEGLAAAFGSPAEASKGTG